MLTFNNKILTVSNKGLEVEAGPTPPPVDPYNPLNLPANTVRVRTNNGNAPTKGTFTSYESATLVEGTTDVYDVYKSGTDMYLLLMGSHNVVEVLGANTTGITNIDYMFQNCSELQSVPLFDTSNVTSMMCTFQYSGITSVPLLDTSKVTNMASTFESCSHVESGALALYQQVSSQANPPSVHDYTFTDCGSDTTTGSAELAQIPSGWK